MSAASSDHSYRTNVIEKAISEIQVVPSLKEGIPVTKISAVGRPSSRYLTLSDDKFQLFITSSKVKDGKFNNSMLKKPLLKRIRDASTGSTDAYVDGDQEKVIDIGSIDRIQMGQNTVPFENLRSERSPRTPKIMSSPKSRSKACFFDIAEDDRIAGKNPYDNFDSRSFSIIFRGERSLALITNTDEDRDFIIDTLDELVIAYRKAKVKVSKDILLLRYIWTDVDKDQSNTISQSEMAVVLNRINFWISKRDLSLKYRDFLRKIGLVKKARTRGLTFSQCVTFLHMIKRDTWELKPVNKIWDDLFGEIRSTGERRMKISAESFLKKFLLAKQGQSEFTIDMVRDLYSKLNQMEIANLASNLSDGRSSHIDKSRFEAYLMSRENDIFDPEKERLDRSTMHEPLCYYWINSSHNTYLLGDQLTSQSAVGMYMVALHRGCRCVEIDTWDGEKSPIDQQPIPIVYHGHSMTSKILFSDIILAINTFLLFNPETYPIIISLENHCSQPYQEVMATHLLSTFGERLFKPHSNDSFEKLPSPHSLKGRVILKGHRKYVEEDDTDTEMSSLNGETDDTQSLRAEPQPTKKVRFKICASLSRLTFFHGSKFKNFKDSQRNKPYEMHSFSEGRVVRYCKMKRDWIIYNQTNMSRVFPVGTRVNSTNYNPLLAWSAGCQLVALNFQTPDAYMRVNDGHFRVNGSCGYVLKPQHMLQERFIEFSPDPISLKVQVLCGSSFPKPKGQKRGECIDPYVKVILYDISSEDGSNVVTTETTNVVENNGFYPIWKPEQSTFHFSVQSQNIAILQFTVMDRDTGVSDDFIASAAIPISCLRKGFRSVQLFDSNNTVSGAFDFATLLVDLEVERTLAEI